MRTRAWTVFWWVVAASVATAALIPAFDTFVLNSPELLADQGASWYYWKLPPDQVTALTRASAWVPYLIHQILLWYFIHRLRTSGKRWDGTLNRWNWAMLGLTAAMTVVHFAQTALFYDGLAQDVTVWSSQYSVIVMLVFILMMRNADRGLFFGKKVRLPRSSIALTRRWHGYYIAWATTYTFWFHPVVNEWAHVIGFLYMFLLFGEIALARTSVHRNKYWTTALEVLVLIHGSTVALLTQDSALWTMFFTGFLTIFIVTQIYGLGLPKVAIRLASVAYLAVTLFLYTFYPSGAFSTERLASIHQVTWIPSTEYALVFIFTAVLWAVSLLPGVRSGGRSS